MLIASDLSALRWRPIFLLMDPYKTTLERAFEIAKSGDCESLNALRDQLKMEGYYKSQVTGRGLVTQLSEIIKRAANSSS